MIQIEYIRDGAKSLFTIIFNKQVMEHLNVKVDDNLNFFQSCFKKNIFTIFKADTGYRITRSRWKKVYQIQVRHPIHECGEFELTPCIYFMKKNGIIKIFITQNED